MPKFDTSVQHSGSKSSHLDEEHRTALHAKGLTDEIIDAAGIHSADVMGLVGVLGWIPGPSQLCRAMVVPHYGPRGATGYCRVKLDKPRRRPDGSVIEVECPEGVPPQAYFPPGFCDALEAMKRKDCDYSVIITNGELNALAGMTAGYPTIGLTDPWAWQDRRGLAHDGTPSGKPSLSPDLAAVGWKRHHVLIALDWNPFSMPRIEGAVAALAEALRGAGAATVRINQIHDVGHKWVSLAEFIAYKRYPDKRCYEIRPFDAQHVQPTGLAEMEWARSIIDSQFTRNEDLTLRSWRSEFYLWNGRCYAKIPRQEMKAHTLLWMDAHGNKEEKRGASRATPRCADTLLGCIEAICGVPSDQDQPCWLGGANNPDPAHVIAFRNGLVHLAPDGTELQLRAHTPRWFSATSLEYDYDPQAQCPQWVRFLGEVLDNDPECIDLLQRWFGLLLTADTSHQKLLLLVGPPRAGKGVVCRVLQHVVGEDNCTSPTLTSLAGNFGLWSLLGKAVALFPDAHLGGRSDSMRIMETIKSVVGEDRLNVDRKFLPVLQNVQVGARFVVTVNELPEFGDASGAMQARLCLLPFLRSFAGSEDRHLTGRLKAEAAGIANWAMEGLRRLTTEGEFNTPMESEMLMEQFTRLASPITAFTKDCCDVGAGKRDPCGDVYAAWQAWAEENGYPGCPSARFGEKLRAAHPAIGRIRPRVKGDRIYSYTGLELNTQGRELLERWRQKERQGSSG